MYPYRVIAVPSTVAESVRATLVSPGYRHPAHHGPATGYGPCRHCLRTFKVGVDRRILFTYDPFEGLEPLPLPGPVFIHAEPCDRYPEDGGFPDELSAHPLTFNGYRRGRRLVAQEYVTDGTVEPLIERLLARPDINYLHVRDTRAGCYDLRIERL
jgi:hypothetical protein